ncbi:TPM domain-containing protein [Stakelama saccharophila]|uniref:TPM domain-containing protein n=1 Tax=Stakelama saccharophila TaxID=3075605 RepID=A0ABZ0B9G8_9SPHN|nr:TPM domain-containing protein [Stakelama sp. W311]WNO53928.1 hypothetical protein RPR59_01320 [Stakelama sp. W311]
MARATRLSPEEHARVTAAVRTAEIDTDGEIVTIIARRSDSYRDTALQYGALAMLALVGLVAIWPGLAAAALVPFTGGWGTPDPREAFTALLFGQAILFLIARFGLAWTPLKIALTPRATRSRRVRRRAVALFRASAEKRTETRVGILLYLSLEERMAEIVADEAIHKRVASERWGDAMAALVEHVRAGDTAAGMAAAVEEMATILRAEFPKSDGNPNELPDRLIEL